MYNRYSKELKPTIMLSVITIISIIIGFDINLSLFFFIYGVTVGVLPICLKDSSISLGIKLFIAVCIGIFSVLIIYYLINRPRLLYLYMIAFFIAIFFSIVSNSRIKRD